MMRQDRISRWAWLGRTSTDNLQDPTLSLPRQLANCQAALPDGAVIVARFYDIESGRKDLDERGHGRSHEQFTIGIPRDGGIQDLLAEAQRPGRRFDAVICESIDRIARRTYYGTKIEHELERAGVLLVAADEPAQAGRKRATAILTRRVKQGVAEWYALEALEKAWDGFKEHTHQGFNVGRPPYGYLAEKIPHPVPARREQGKTKTRLVPDPVRAPVVRHIFDLYLTTGAGLQQIRDLLNQDPGAYPPPTPPDPRRALGKWSTSSVWEILRNPKYTGFMVWNRRARKSGGNRTNPPTDWIWSPQPTHPPLVSRAEHQAVSARAAANEASRRPAIEGQPAPKKPGPRAEYLYRGLLRCGICGLRMTGNIRRATGRHYYFCYPHKQRSANIPSGHPPTVYLAEQPLHEGITAWMATALFGADRLAYWRDALTAATDRDGQHRAPVEARIAELDRETTDLDRRLRRQILNLEDDDITPAARRQITTRIAELEDALNRHHATLNALRAELAAGPPDPDQTAELLQLLPDLADELSDLPQRALRRLYDALDLKISYHPEHRTADVEITLTDTIGDTYATAPPDQRVGPSSQVCSVPPERHRRKPPPRTGCPWRHPGPGRLRPGRPRGGHRPGRGRGRTGRVGCRGPLRVGGRERRGDRAWLTQLRDKLLAAGVELRPRPGWRQAS